jgi:hypothetical protein
MLILKKACLFLMMLVIAGNVCSQSRKRLQPGKLYEPGEKIYAPRYGFEGVVPEGWDGTLPRESEMFLLMPRTPIGGEVFTFSSVNADLKSIQDGWVKGVNLSETILIKAKGSPTIEGDMITAEVVSEGPSINKGYKGFAIARCGPYGKCITSLGIGPVQFFDQVKTAVTSFMSSATFSEPADISIYADFDWKEFLSDKMLIAFMAIESGSQSGSKENTVHLCGDGTFMADLHKKGIVKDYNPQYKGRQSGTWSAEGIGEQGTLTLKFKKLPETVITLNIKDEKITANGERYFAAESDKCK